MHEGRHCPTSRKFGRPPRTPAPFFGNFHRLSSRIPLGQTVSHAILETLYADDHLLVFDKPGGLHAVPGRGEDKQDCLSARAQARYPDALVVHRLDRDTSGLLLMARGKAMQSALSRAFMARTVEKRYVAVVEGILAPPDTEDGWGDIDLPILLDWPNRPRRIIDPRGKPSLTRWRVLPGSAPEGCTRLELEPFTGRSHQLRVHLRAIGHPILGDTLYASDAGQARAGRLLLHAWKLGFTHPVTGLPLALESPPPF